MKIIYAVNGVDNVALESDEDDDDGSSDHNACRLDIYSFSVVATQTVESANQFVMRRDLKWAFNRIGDDHPLKKTIVKCLVCVTHNT